MMNITSTKAVERERARNSSQRYIIKVILFVSTDDNNDNNNLINPTMREISQSINQIIPHIEGRQSKSKSVHLLEKFKKKSFFLFRSRSDNLIAALFFFFFLSCWINSIGPLNMITTNARAITAKGEKKYSPRSEHLRLDRI